MPLYRLVRIGYTAHSDDLRFPSRRTQLLAQQQRGFLLDQDLGLEIQSGRKSQIFVCGPRITIDATVLTAPVWVNTGTEADIRTVIVSDQRSGMIFKKL